MCTGGRFFRSPMDKGKGAAKMKKGSLLLLCGILSLVGFSGGDSKGLRQERSLLEERTSNFDGQLGCRHADRLLFVRSLAVDGSGTVWAGTEEGGLYRKKSGENVWRKDVDFSAAFGENVFALSVDGSGLLWAGTLDCGVCTWDGESWRAYGLREGLPGNRVFSLSPTGGGMLIATDGGIADWSLRRGTIETYDRMCGLLQNEANGIVDCGKGDLFVATQSEGLMRRARVGEPFHPIGVDRIGRCNAILRLRNGGLAVGTANGLWFGGRSSGKWNPCVAVPNYVTALLEDETGNLYAGTRESGVVVLDENARLLRRYTFGGFTNRITSLAVDARGIVLAGTYGGGVVELHETKSRPRGQPMGRKAVRPQHPANPIERRAKPIRLQKEDARVNAFYLTDDWATKGDWCGRYGGRTAHLCAMYAPWDSLVIGRDWGSVIKGRMGEHHREGDVLRQWVHWIYAENRNSLYVPVIGYRRQAEWDDHSESYPASWEGPNIIISVSLVTSGWHRVSFYFNNKDGHEGENFRRDYTVETDDGTGRLVRSRVVGFRNGVYKSFAVKGPGTKEFRIRRHGSFSTILSAVFVDLFFEPREVQSCPRSSTYMYYGGVVYSPPETRDFALPEFTAYTPAYFDQWRRQVRRDYRQAVARAADAAVLENYRWSLLEWTREDRQKFDYMTLLMWTALQFRDAAYRDGTIYRRSPNVLNRPVVDADYQSPDSDSWTKSPDVMNPRLIEEPRKGFFRELQRIQRCRGERAEE